MRFKVATEEAEKMKEVGSKVTAKKKIAKKKSTLKKEILENENRVKKKKPVVKKKPVEKEKPVKKKKQMEKEKLVRKEKILEKKKLREKKKVIQEKKVIVQKEYYGYYLKKILKILQPHTTISREALNNVNDLMNHIFQSVVSEASRLTKEENCSTLIHPKIEIAVKNLFPGLLKKQAIMEGTKAIMRFKREIKKKI